MAAGGGFYAVAAYSTGVVLFGLIVIGWCADRLNLRRRVMIFRITTGQGQSVATEVQRLLADMAVVMRHFRVSMTGTTSIVEFEAEVGHSQQEKIVTQLNRQGVVTDVIPFEGHPNGP
jgi:uncharacterized membrane protein YhiD involved in acid resistance